MIKTEEFAKGVEYAKKAGCLPYATIPALSKMLGRKNFEVMEYLEEHPDLVHTEERFAPKTITVTDRFPGSTFKPIKRQVQTKGKSLGLCIIEAYRSKEENPWTEEWLKKTIRKYEKTIWVAEWDNYGLIEGLYLPRTNRSTELKENELFKDNHRNDFLWKNTPEKLEAAKALGATFETTYYIGGFGDCSNHHIEYAIESKGIQILKDNGWTVIMPN